MLSSDGGFPGPDPFCCFFLVKQNFPGCKVANTQTEMPTCRPYICSFKHINTPTFHEKTITECFSFIKLVGSESISESYREVFEGPFSYKKFSPPF